MATIQLSPRVVPFLPAQTAPAPAVPPDDQQPSVLSALSMLSPVASAAGQAMGTLAQHLGPTVRHMIDGSPTPCDAGRIVEPTIHALRLIEEDVEEASRLAQRVARRILAADAVELWRAMQILHGTSGTARAARVLLEKILHDRLVADRGTETRPDHQRMTSMASRILPTQKPLTLAATAQSLARLAETVRRAVRPAADTIERSRQILYGRWPVANPEAIAKALDVLSNQAELIDCYRQALEPRLWEIPELLSRSAPKGRKERKEGVVPAAPAPASAGPAPPTRSITRSPRPRANAPARHTKDGRV